MIKVKDSRKCIKFIKKYCYIIIPLISATFLIMLNINKQKVVFLKNIKYGADDISTIIGISGTLIGFLFTAVTVFLSLPKDTPVMKRIKKYNHHKIFINCVLYGIIILCLDIILWLLKVNYFYIILMMLLGLEETIMAAYYTYKFCLFSFQ